SAVDAADRRHSDSLDSRLRTIGPAFRASGGHVGIPQKAPFDRLVVSGSGGDRRHPYGADTDGDRVTRFGVFHVYGLCHFVSTAKSGGDHRSPTSRGRVGHDKSSVAHRTQHRLFRVENTVGKGVDINSVAGRFLHGRISSCHSSYLIRDYHIHTTLQTNQTGPNIRLKNDVGGGARMQSPPVHPLRHPTMAPS